MSHHVCKLGYMSNLYRITSYSLKLLMHEVEYGRIGLPDIQRPFVWGTVKVRNLLDSMYRGYPVGTLLFWDTGADPSLRQIDSSSGSVAKLAIVDGQQRLTSLYAVLRGCWECLGLWCGVLPWLFGVAAVGWVDGCFRAGKEVEVEAVAVVAG